MKMKKPKKMKSHIFEEIWFWTVLAFFCAFLCVTYALFQVNEFEKGVIEIYANQQDTYVQLVLDQININKTEEDPEVILNIIGTLDNSTNKYWTLAHEEILIFVKDVLETNQYKGFTSSTYFTSESARKFSNSLMVNRVTHSTIQIAGRRFIASGVIFQYNNEDYQICLLTSPDVILEQNEYLGAKVGLGVMLLTLLLTFILIVVLLSRMVSKRALMLKKEQEALRSQNTMIEALNEKLAKSDLYDVRKSVFHVEYMPMLFAKLKDRHVSMITMMLIKCNNQKARNAFLDDSVLMMDRRIMRFRDNREDTIILVAVGLDEMRARKEIDWILYEDLYILATYTIEDLETTGSENALQNLYSRVKENEK